MAAPWIEPILKLQELDMKIQNLNKRLELLPSEMKILLEKKDEAIASTNKAVEFVKKISRAIKGGELEIKQREEKLNKLKQQSSLVKKNTEYQAMLHEIEATSKEISDFESKILVAMEKLNLAKEQGKKIKARNDAIISSAKTEYEEFVEFSNQLKKEIEKLEKERPALADKINKEALSKYNLLLKSKFGGAPMVEVIDGICGYCHLKVTQQAMTEIKKGQITSCDNCQHLIYSEECIY